MGHSRFDGISRLVGRAASRRDALLAALGALGAAGEAAGRSSRRKRRPRPEGPCGDGSRKANICRKNSQCCTGYCQKNLKNKDKRGRCRCIRKGQPCKPDQVCCNTQCLKGICGVGIATGKACAADDTCADPAATCRAYGEYEPAGTYCLLPNGKACAANDNCVSSNCDTGVCKPKTCTVCASGCQYDDLSAALAAAADGAVVRVDAGDWEVTGTNGQITDGRTVTVRACNGVSGVDISGSATYVFSVGEVNKGPISASGHWILEGLTIANSSSNYAYAVGVGMMAPDTGGLTLRRCTLDASASVGLIIQGDSAEVLVEDCRIEKMALFSGVRLIQLGGDPVQFVRTVFTGAVNQAALYTNGGRAVLTDCTVSDNVTGSDGAISFRADAASGGASILVLAGTTTVTRNTATIPGTPSILLAAAQDNGVDFRIEPTASVTGNTGVSDGAGLLVSTSLAPASANTYSGLDRIFGNTGGSTCATAPESFPPYTVTAAPGCVF